MLDGIPSTCSHSLFLWYNRNMAANISRNVGDLPANDKQSLEHLLGQPLKPTERVYIVAFNADEPTADTRHTTADALDDTLAQALDHAQLIDLTENDIDVAVDEAMQHVRRRQPDEGRS